MLLVYGAYGYTGTLVAELAAARGLKPIVAGRQRALLEPLARRLGTEARAFDLAGPDLRGVRVVLHCAGPFSATSRPMLSACLAAGVHYLDVTGEVEVFEAVLARDTEARVKGCVLLPGVGFDVVPSDCLAKRLHEALPSATSLVLAFAPKGKTSPGTAKTALENLPRGGCARIGGKLVPVPPAWKTMRVPFADKERLAMSIPWGDLATAFRSTGIPDITVFIAARPATVRAARFSRFAAPFLRLGPVQAFLRKRIERNVRGPSAAERATGSVELWGRATDGTRSVEATMTVPEGYSFTAEAAVECARRVLEGQVKPGAWTPSLAFGAGFAESLPGVRFRLMA